MSRRNEAMVDIFCEFLEVAIHIILHTRSLYPPGVFKLRQKYGAPVQICFHPDVSSYVTQIITSLRPAIVSREVSKLAIDIKDSHEHRLERVVIEIGGYCNNIKENAMPVRVLEEHLRAAVLKLSIADSFMAPLPQEEKSWQILAISKTSCFSPARLDNRSLEAFHWIMENAGSDTDFGACEPLPLHIVPLKSVRTELLQMQIYVEQYKTPTT